MYLCQYITTILKYPSNNGTSSRLVKMLEVIMMEKKVCENGTYYRMFGVLVERWIPAYRAWYEGTNYGDSAREYPKCVATRILDYLKALKKERLRCIACGACKGVLPDLLLSTEDAFYHFTCTKIENKERRK